MLHSLQIGDQWRLASCSGKDPSIQDQAWESIPLFACPRNIHLVISPFFTNKHCFHLFFQPQDVADLVSSEVRNVLSKINGMVYKSRHKNKRFAEGIFITPLPLLQDNTSSALSSYVSVFFLHIPSLRSIYCCSIALYRIDINHALLPALSLIAPDVRN